MTIQQHCSFENVDLDRLDQSNQSSKVHSQSSSSSPEVEQRIKTELTRAGFVGPVTGYMQPFFGSVDGAGTHGGSRSSSLQGGVLVGPSPPSVSSQQQVEYPWMREKKAPKRSALSQQQQQHHTTLVNDIGKTDLYSRIYLKKM